MTLKFNNIKKNKSCKIIYYHNLFNLCCNNHKGRRKAVGKYSEMNVKYPSYKNYVNQMRGRIRLKNLAVINLMN